MKKTKYIKAIEKENFEFHRIRFLLWLKMKFSISKEKKKSKKRQLEIFNEINKFEHSQINSLPHNIYYKPTDILIYDLIQKQDLDKIKRGIFSLFKHNMSHKFLTIAISQDDIAKAIQNLDHTISSSKSWYRIGLFDFANNAKIDRYIHHFEIYLRNFSSSYIAVEFVITLADTFQNEVGDFISSNYKNCSVGAYKIWVKNSKKNRG